MQLKATVRMAESENYTYKGLSQRRSAIYPAGCPQMFSCEAGTVPDPDALHPSVEHYPLTYHENLPLIFPNGSLARRLPAWQLLTIVTFLPHPGEREPAIIADSPCHFFSASWTLYAHFFHLFYLFAFRISYLEYFSKHHFAILSISSTGNG